MDDDDEINPITPNVIMNYNDEINNSLVTLGRKSNFSKRTPTGNRVLNRHKSPKNSIGNILPPDKLKNELKSTNKTVPNRIRKNETPSNEKNKNTTSDRRLVTTPGKNEITHLKRKRLRNVVKSTRSNLITNSYVSKNKQDKNSINDEEEEEKEEKEEEEKEEEEKEEEEKEEEEKEKEDNE